MVGAGISMTFNQDSFKEVNLDDRKSKAGDKTEMRNMSETFEKHLPAEDLLH